MSTVRSLLAAAALLVVVGIAAACGSPVTPRLGVGDCINLSSPDAITSIPRVACTESHTGEVFHVFDATGSAAAYPSDADWGTLIYPVCDPVFETYTGTPIEERADIDYIYLVPTSDRWSAGDRRVTCVIQSIDGAPLTQSYRSDG